MDDEQRRRGRPRSAEADRAILEAARDLLIADGYEQLTMQAIAERAGVGRQTVYRRWPSKAGIVAEAVMAGLLSPVPSDMAGGADATAPADLRAWLHAAAVGLSDATNLTIVRALAAAAAETDAGAIRLYRAFTEQGRTDLIDLLRTAVARCEVRADADLEAAADAIQGAVLYTALAYRPPKVEHLDSLADLLLAGLAPR
ncbi:TetR/AcrR family transcriptional regulator [Agromyces intestinalis]|uniref:TetR/AcrR family transcriptional regulator n=1 Tax=Agromyces intestinalis TaxID=2592652 RepID=A0A5C1YCL7_9MICO|nr:TetR/AcrR family transcriptional regulator [Agromyces intestinalis]QEO13844.1 TetR/AcrR family transcriptional regulator [Agromyces intestinalis]